MLNRFMTWLLSLLPTPEPVPMEGEAMEGISVSNADTAMPILENIPLYLLIAAIAVAVIAVILWLILHWGKKARISRVSVGTQRRSRPKSRASRTLLARIAFFLKYLAHRSTPEGWLIRCERWATRHRRGRGKGETPRAFLTRLAQLSADARPGLLALADALDARFYGNGGAALGNDDTAALKKLLR